MAKRSDQNFSPSVSRAKLSGKHKRFRRPRITISRGKTPNMSPDRARSFWGRLADFFTMPPWGKRESFDHLNKGSKEAKRGRQIRQRGQDTQAPRIYNQRRK